jgi:hypothetical protein
MLSSDGFFDRDGTAVKFLQNLPLIGYIVADLDRLNGDEVKKYTLHSLQ